MKILAFAGSARANSFNRQLLAVAATAIEACDVTVTYFEFGQFPLPLYDGDMEQSSGLPGNARLFKQALIAHDGFLIASPEYNSAYSPLLKNAIDWASRSESAEEPPLCAFTNKTAAIISTSPGALGGLRGLNVLRMLLTNINVHVLPKQIAIAKAHEAFTEQGTLSDERQHKNMTALAAEFVDFTSRLSR